MPGTDFIMNIRPTSTAPGRGAGSASRHMTGLACGVAILGAATCGWAAEARPHGEMKTRWAAQMNPEAPLPEYPRPTLERANWTNLNGKWDYAITPRGAQQPANWDGKIVVPFPVESQLSGVQRTVGADKRLWYRRDFQKPAADGERVFLHFGAVDWEAQVWVNGVEMGVHKGGFDPFSFDVTEALKDGANELTVAVWDPTDRGPQPRGKQVEKPEGIWYTAVTGIWQTVWMETTPAVHLKSIVPYGDPATGELRLDLTASAPAKVKVTVTDGGQAVAGGDADFQNASGSITLKISDAKAWTPDSPHLYGLEITCGRDVVKSYAAFRTISMEKDKHGVNRLFLNGSPVFHYGPLDQGWWPDGLYTAPTDEALRFDIEATREMGFNMARKHVKVEPERWYYWADKLGLMVWQDMPSASASAGNPPRRTDDDLFRGELDAMIQARRFHPSIVAWIPYNEGWGQPNAEITNAVLQWTKREDPSRFVGAASGWTDHGWGDWKDRHDYPGPGMDPLMDNRASVLGEFGGLGLPVEGHLWWNKRNWGYRDFKTGDDLKKAYGDLMTRLTDLVPRGLAAAVYTQTTDCEGEVNGLLTYDRERKFDHAWLRGVHAPLYEPAGRVLTTVVLPTAETEAREWAYVTEKPADGWEKHEFDDSAWKRGPAGFGTRGTPGAKVRTEWKERSIWLRRGFELAELPKGALTLRIHHDEDARVFINGRQVARLEGYTGNYRELRLNDEAKAALRQGRNTLAIQVIQTQGGQYIDAGLVEEVRIKD